MAESRRTGGARDGEPAAFVPVADVYVFEEYIVVRLAVPGVLAEDIDVSFGPEGLVVRGELERPVAADEGRVVVSEWRYGYFERVITLPQEIDSSGLRIEFEDGVLELRLPLLGR